MECPPPPGAPTFVDELKRGVNPFNLGVGAITAVAFGFLSGGAALAGWLPYSPVLVASVAGISLFVLVTVLHTLAHAGMGLVFEHGLKAYCRGDYRTARRWLQAAGWKGMDHYDPQGVALAALNECRQQS